MKSVEKQRLALFVRGLMTFRESVVNELPYTQQTKLLVKGDAPISKRASPMSPAAAGHTSDSSHYHLPWPCTNHQKVGGHRSSQLGTCHTYLTVLYTKLTTHRIAQHSAVPQVTAPVFLYICGHHQGQNSLCTLAVTSHITWLVPAPWCRYPPGSCRSSGDQTAELTAHRYAGARGMGVATCSDVTGQLLNYGIHAYGRGLSILATSDTSPRVASAALVCWDRCVQRVTGLAINSIILHIRAL